MNRRTLLQGTATGSLLLLARCAGQSVQTIDAQIIADVQGLQTMVTSVLASINAYNPTAISVADQQKITVAEAAITAGLKVLSATTPVATGATTLAQVQAALQTVLTVIGAALPVAATAFPALVPFVPMYDAGVALLPVVVAYVASIVKQVTGTVYAVSVLPAPIRVRYTEAQALLILHIKEVN